MRINKGIIFSLSFLALSAVSGLAVAEGWCPCSPPSLTFIRNDNVVSTYSLVPGRDATGVKRCQYNISNSPIGGNWSADYYFEGRGECEGKNASCKGKAECKQTWTPQLTPTPRLNTVQDRRCEYEAINPYAGTLRSSWIQKVGLVNRSSPAMLCDVFRYYNIVTTMNFTSAAVKTTVDGKVSKCHYTNQTTHWEGWYYIAGTQGSCEPNWTATVKNKGQNLDSGKEGLQCTFEVSGPKDDTLTGEFASYANKSAIFYKFPNICHN